jgi:hypothetical protein
VGIRALPATSAQCVKLSPSGMQSNP